MRALRSWFVPFLIGLSILHGWIPGIRAVSDLGVHTKHGLAGRIRNQFSRSCGARPERGALPTVGISLWNDGVFVQDITLSTENDGRYDWSVPGNLVGGAYSIQIWETGGGLIAISNSIFSSSCSTRPSADTPSPAPCAPTGLPAIRRPSPGKASDMPAETPSTSTSGAMGSTTEISPRTSQIRDRPSGRFPKTSSVSALRMCCSRILPALLGRRCSFPYSAPYLPTALSPET